MRLSSSYLLFLAMPPLAVFANDPPVLPLGSPAPEFDLVGVDGKRLTLKDFSDAKLLLVVFTANHCPTARAYEERLKTIVADYRPQGVAVVAISSNSPKGLRLNEQGYTDLGDTLEDMKIRATDKGFDFPYLYDGDTQAVAKAYGPRATPHVFLFDAARKLRYVGRIDDHEREAKVKVHDLRNALDALLAGGEPPVTQTKVMGCSLKWAEKEGEVRAYMEKLAAEPVTLEKADVEVVKALRQVPEGGKVRLINAWSLGCPPCIAEFPDLVMVDRMYRQRAFEFVAVCTDPPADEAKALEFLKGQQASNRNLIFATDDDYALVEALDPAWSGTLPYTLLVAPGGKVLYRKEGKADILELRRAIVGSLPEDRLK